MATLKTQRTLPLALFKKEERNEEVGCSRNIEFTAMLEETFTLLLFVNTANSSLQGSYI